MCNKYQNFATASLLSIQPTDFRFENHITILWSDPEVLHFRPRTGQKWNKLRYTELFSAIFISCIIFSRTFDLKCHNEIKCFAVVRNLVQLRLSSTITLNSPYFKLTGCAQFIISASMFAKSNTIVSGRQPRQGAKVLQRSRVVIPWNGELSHLDAAVPVKILLNPVAAKASKTPCSLNVENS